MADRLKYDDVAAAAARIHGAVRPVAVVPAEPVAPPDGPSVCFALEQLQFTGTFKARGAQNFVRAHHEAGSFPAAGVTIASGGNAGMACAWSASQHDVRATVFVPSSVPQLKIDRLRSYRADVRLIDGPFADAWDACDAFAEESGALRSHAYDDRFIAAGAGTVMLEIVEQVPELDTVAVAVGGGGLFSGIAAVARHHGIRVIAVEPERAPTLHAALGAGRPVEVEVGGVAADSLGGRRASASAVAAAQHGDVRSVLVSDDAIIEARQRLWDEHRLAVEHAAGAALAGISGDGYRPATSERVCVVLCGANTDPSDLQ
ncbi:threonine/serine dehydratase [Tomitella cavernea]|uniref:Threonine/serine dehydratase n=1 Tax=Tomitella cavernea TaxID=1387982 RepID=A0ABP9CXT2_9ACTN|nr:threonine/serine dehydratase [Tomitella cavernea]